MAMDNKGGYGAATTHGIFHLWICQDGKTTVEEYHGLNG
jgi:hypothetical protein